jgi:hypothetical protein
VSSQDETDVTLAVSDAEPGRANDVAFRIVKDLMALAAIIESVNDGIGGAPKQYVRVQANDTQADYLVDKLVDGDGVLLTVLDAAGVKTIKIDARTKNSVEIDGDQIQLVGDLPSPGNNKIYGTTNVGDRAWHSLDDDIHGNLSGGLLHEVATPVLSGFMSAADKDKLDEFPSYDEAVIPVVGNYYMFFANPNPPANWQQYVGFTHHSKIVYSDLADGGDQGGTVDATLAHDHVFNHNHDIQGYTELDDSSLQDQGSGSNTNTPRHDHEIDIVSQNSNPNLTSNNTQERYLKVISARRTS